MFELAAALAQVIAAEGSDLHLKVGSRPMVRAHGRLAPIAGSEALLPEDTERVFSEMLIDEVKLGEFRAEHEVGLLLLGVRAGALPRQRLPSARLGLDRLPRHPLRDQVGRRAPAAARHLGAGRGGARDHPPHRHHRSGKSTTLAAIIDQINSREAKHIVTIEDPIEYLHADKRSVVNQREVGEDTTSFATRFGRPPIPTTSSCSWPPGQRSTSVEQVLT